jgi:hypothetical protein
MLIVDAQIHLWEKGTPSAHHRQEPYSAEQAIASMDAAGAEALAGEINAMGVVNEAVEDGIGISRVADKGVPFVNGDLAGENGRAFFEDLVEVTTGTGIERFEAPIVEDEELDAGEAATRAWRPSPRASASSANSLGTR